MSQKKHIRKTHFEMVCMNITHMFSFSLLVSHSILSKIESASVLKIGASLQQVGSLSITVSETVRNGS